MASTTISRMLPSSTSTAWFGPASDSSSLPSAPMHHDCPDGLEPAQGAGDQRHERRVGHAQQLTPHARRR